MSQAMFLILFSWARFGVFIRNLSLLHSQPFPTVRSVLCTLTPFLVCAQYLHTYTYIHAHAHTCVCVHVCVCVCKIYDIYIHTYIHTYICMHIYVSSSCIVYRVSYIVYHISFIIYHLSFIIYQLTTYTYKSQKQHKRADHSNVVSKRCHSPGCAKRPIFGDPRTRELEFCRQHKLDFHVDCQNKRCVCACACVCVCVCVCV